MKNKAITLILAILTLNISQAQELKVFDQTDSLAISGAMITAQNGVILGLTDPEGKIATHPRHYPVEVRATGYQTQTIAHAGDIYLQPRPYQLNEIVATNANRPIHRLLCYVDEYCSAATASDTMILYSQYMYEYYYVSQKTKGYKESDSRGRQRNAEYIAIWSKQGSPDSIATPTPQDEITALTFANTLNIAPDWSKREPQTITDGAKHDTIYGKHSPIELSCKQNGTYTITRDLLANHAHHKFSPAIFKLFGLTMDLTQFEIKQAYADTGRKEHTMAEFIQQTTNMHLTGRGKLFNKIFNTKQPVEIDTYIQMYPIDLTHITIEEYKQLRKDQDPIAIQRPQTAGPRHAVIEKQIKNMATEQL